MTQIFSISPAGSGKLVSIERIIDRERDAYRETVKDEHEQVIAQKDEKLSKHR